MISSRDKNFDSFLGGGFKENIYLVFGPSATGKTTLCLQSALNSIEQNKKILFVDCEGGFSIERIRQMKKEFDAEILNNLIVIRLNDFDQQYKFFQDLEKIIEEGDFDFLIIDTIGKHYRKEIQENNHLEINEKMVTMLRSLKHIKINRNIPILMTNQVYSDLEGNIKNVGGKMIENFGEVIVELKKDPRKAIMMKPEKKEIYFKITELGIVV